MPLSSSFGELHRVYDRWRYVRENVALKYSIAVARLPSDARAVFAEHLERMAKLVSSVLPPEMSDRDNVALSIYAAIIGTLQLARAVAGTEMSDRILAAGAEAARTLA